MKDLKYIKLFEQFLNEDSVRAGEESDIYIDDMKLDNGGEIGANEILGAIVSSNTEKELKDYFYKKYGNGSFTEKELSSLVKYWNDYRAEQAEAEKEEEKEEEGGGSDGEDGGLDLDI